MKDMIEEAKGHAAQPSRVVENPRYARVNTLKWSFDEALQGSSFYFNNIQNLVSVSIW